MLKDLPDMIRTSVSTIAPPIEQQTNIKLPISNAHLTFSGPKLYTPRTSMITHPQSTHLYTPDPEELQRESLQRPRRLARKLVSVAVAQDATRFLLGRFGGVSPMTPRPRHHSAAELFL